MYPFTKAQKCFERHFSSSSSSLDVINASNVFHCFHCTYFTTNQAYCICKTHEKKCNVSFIYFFEFSIFSSSVLCPPKVRCLGIDEKM